MDDVYDVAIIGGGVTGCSSVLDLTNHGYSCILLEKYPHFVAEVSSGNSGMIHNGFDAPDDSIEADCIQRSQIRIYDLLDKLRVPVQRIGATMVAWTPEHLQLFPGILDKSCRLGMSDIIRWSASDLYRHEPNLSPGALGAISIPGESVTDPWLFPISLANNARRKGAQILLNARVHGCHRNDQSWDLDTARGKVKARCVVNCAGLHGDKVEAMVGQTGFKIQPIKGQYNIHSVSARHLINSSILPVPSKIGKGIIVFKSVYNNVIVGPTRDIISSPEQAKIETATSKRLLNVARETVQSLETHDVIRKYKGVRPATQFKDYIIKASPEKSWITVGGIRSTGLSGCLGIGETVRELVTGELKLEPSVGRDLQLHAPEVTFTRDGSALVDGIEHCVTHPITLAGRCNDPGSKL